jgi:hypothetical protein
MPRRTYTSFMQIRKAFRFKNCAATIAVAIAALVLNTAARGFYTPDQTSEFFFTAAAAVKYNDNVFLQNSGQTGLTIFDLTPGFEYDYGKGSLIEGVFAFNETFSLYSQDSSKLSDDLADISFTAKYENGKSKAKLDAAFQQLDQSTVDIHRNGYLVKRNVTEVDSGGETGLTAKTSIGAEVTYNDTDYTTAGYDSLQYVEIPVNYYYEVDPGLDVSAGFRFRNNTLTGAAPESDDYFFNVGARGEFTPKITGEFNVGYQVRKFTEGGDQNGLGLTAKFTYAYSPVTTFTIGLDNDFGYAAVGTPQRLSGGNIGVRNALNAQWSLNGQFGYTRYDYTTTAQRDGFYTGQVGVTFQYSHTISFAATYSYSQDSSNLRNASFENNIVSLTGTLRE